MRLGRYALYGFVITFAMYLAGAAYRHDSLSLNALAQNSVPLILWGVFAGLAGGLFTMGLEAVTNFVKTKRPTKPKP